MRFIIRTATCFTPGRRHPAADAMAAYRADVDHVVTVRPHRARHAHSGRVH